MLNKLKERHETQVGMRGGIVGAFEGEKGFVSWVDGLCDRQWGTLIGTSQNKKLKKIPQIENFIINMIL